MEELSIEKKAKAYDEALDRAKKLKETCDSTAVVGWCEYIFPEIRESEDESIRKEIRNFIWGYPNKLIERDKWLAWLEKQGGQKQEINNFDVLPGLYKCVHRMFDGTPDGRLLFEVGNVYRCLSKHDRAEFEVSYGHSVYLEDPVVCKHFIPFEKQGEQKPNPCDECINVKGCINCENGELRETEQKSVDKAESKFKPGDWLVHNERKHIIKIVNHTPFDCEVVDILGYHHTITNTAIENNYHLWTIQDAKDGDVFATDPWSDYPSSFVAIYKKQNGEDFDSYCFVGFDGKFYKGENGHSTEEIHPATKEQRDLLFTKMKEAGYEWDSEKKEVKLLITNGGDFFESENREQKPAWSEDNEKLTNVNHEYFSELLENNNSDNIDDYAYQVAYCMSHDWANETPTWDDVQKACKLGAEWNERRYKSNWDGENDELITAAICFIDSYNDNNGFACNGIYKDDVSKWLKSLRQRTGE